MANRKYFLIMDEQNASIFLMLIFFTIFLLFI